MPQTCRKWPNFLFPQRPQRRAAPQQQPPRPRQRRKILCQLPAPPGVGQLSRRPSSVNSTTPSPGVMAAKACPHRVSAAITSATRHRPAPPPSSTSATSTAAHLRRRRYRFCTVRFFRPIYLPPAFLHFPGAVPPFIHAQKGTLSPARIYSALPLITSAMTGAMSSAVYCASSIVFPFVPNSNSSAPSEQA